MPSPAALLDRARKRLGLPPLGGIGDVLGDVGGFAGDVAGGVRGFVSDVAPAVPAWGRIVASGGIPAALTTRGGRQDLRTVGGAATRSLYEGDNGVLEEALRPINYIPAAKPLRGLSFAPKAGAAARAALEVVAAAAGHKAANVVGEALPEDTSPIVRGAAQLGAGLLAGGGVGVGGARYAGAVKAGKRIPVGMSVEDVGADAAKAVPAKPPIETVFEKIIPGEKPDIGVLRLYEGGLNTQGMEIKRDLDLGNRALKALKIGKPSGTSRVVERFGEGEDLFKALHGEGPIPPRLQSVFDDLKAAVDRETAATLDFDPKFMAHPDYFPRGWREIDVTPPNRVSAPTGRGPIGAVPGFSKPRVDESFTEILEKTYTRADGSQYKLEPISWNPYEMLAVRRVAGAEFREQKTLVARLRQTGQAVVADGPLPEGWRVPRVGPAFEGRPKIAPPDASNAAPSFFGFTDRIATTDRVADVLENQYGRSVSLGKGPEAVLSALQGAKRAKLLASLFQQVDFSTRTGFSMWGGAMGDLLSGKPVSAIAKLVRAPVEIGNVLRMNVSPQGRAAIRDEILSGNPIFKGRAGISLRGVAEAGWQQQDITLIRRDISNTLKDVAARNTAEGLLALPSAAKRNLLRLEAANSRGLFDGVYPQAQTVALKNWILPRLMRQHPEWTDAQIMGNAATEVNKAFSTLGHYQTWFKNPYVNHLTRNLIFSTNEAQAILRGAGSTFLGPNKRLWSEFYLGGALFLGTVANLVHMATTTLETGQPSPLPIDRYNPLRTSEETPLGVEYNPSYMSPDLPLRGEEGRRLMLDTVGQMDTAFRVLDPMWFVRSRFSVGLSAVTNQIQGRDFYWNDIDTVGPKGVVSRGAQLVSDLYEPIGAAHIRQGLGIGAEKSEPVGLAGEAVQATGLNVRQTPEDEVSGRPAPRPLRPARVPRPVRSPARIRMPR